MFVCTMLYPQSRNAQVRIASALQDAFQEYTVLWASMERLLTQLRRRNEPISGEIPRIQEQIADLKRKRATLTVPEQTKSINLEAELNAYQTFHAALWKTFYSLVKAMCTNEYVRGFVAASYTGPAREQAFQTLIAQDYGRMYDVPTEAEKATLDKMYSGHASMIKFEDMLYGRVME